ncbi:MAG: hypothetical protein ACYC5M_12750 [Anaerolineae bacterium]
MSFPPHYLNPRPDLAQDQPLWASLLSAAYRKDGPNPEGLFWALQGLRCLGARLRVGRHTLLLERGEQDEATYHANRTRYLLPHAEVLRTLLVEGLPRKA